MATKKLILDFRENPVVGSAFTYDIYINGVRLVYLNTLNTININYKAGGNNTPLEIGLGADMDETIDNTLAFMASVYVANSSVGGYLTTISYARVDNKLEIIVNSTAPVDKITFFKIFSSNVNIRMTAESPCEFAFITNQSIGQDDYNTLSAIVLPNLYNIKNVTLNTWITQVIPSTIETRLPRGYQYSIYTSFYSLIMTFDIPASLTPANMNIYFTDNNLYVNVVGTVGLLDFDFSIDGVTYQSSNIFEGLATGDHTVYVRDTYGCVKTFVATNNGEENINLTQPYAYVSESNSLRLIRRVDHQNCGNYKNQFNTLSCEENLQIPNKFLQLFQACDTDIKTQVKTSYQNLEVYIKDSAGAFTEIIAQKIVGNIGVEDKRDCIYYTYNGLLAVMYQTGNTYDYGTSDVSGTYELNGQLPDYGTIGTWVETAYGTLQVANIYLDDNGNRSLIFNLNMTLTSPVNGTIQVIYNAESYDIWEFSIDMSLFLNMTFTVGLRMYQTVVDPNFPDIFYISEKVSVKIRHPRSLEVVWSNSKNTDIYFYSGIQMKNRLNNAFINTNLSDGEVEIQRTESQIIPIDATNYNPLEFEVLAITTGIARKLLLALKHDNLIIENVPYVLSENPELERQGQSNFYKLKAKLLEAGDVWNQGTANTQTIYSSTELIGLLQGDQEAEYIRTQ